MNLKLLKRLIVFLLLLPLCMLILGTGCDDNDERETLCYQGKVVNLNQGDGCQNIITITQSADNGKPGSNATIAFDPGLYEGTLKVGDIVYFKVHKYEQWVGPATANCLWPQFTAQIEFCNN